VKSATANALAGVSAADAKAQAIVTSAHDAAKDALAKIDSSGIVKRELMLAKAKLKEAIEWFEAHFMATKPPAA
jgi:hypothetical protein